MSSPAVSKRTQIQIENSATLTYPTGDFAEWRNVEAIPLTVRADCNQQSLADDSAFCGPDAGSNDPQSNCAGRS
jgi:hypothetical protein